MEAKKSIIFNYFFKKKWLELGGANEKKIHF
jgi:hypothetical protein